MTSLSEDEIKQIRTENTLSKHMERPHMSEKLLLCLLETMQEMKQEIKELRATNQRMELLVNQMTWVNIHGVRSVYTMKRD